MRASGAGLPASAAQADARARADDTSKTKYVFKNQRIHTLAREYLDKEFGGVPSSTFNTTGDYIFHSDFIKSHAFVGWFDKTENNDKTAFTSKDFRPSRHKQLNF